MKTQLIRNALAAALIASTSLWAQSNFQFTEIRPLTNKEIALTLSASNGANYRIETTTNFSTWPALVTLPGTNFSIFHTDSAAPYLAQRFYRGQKLDDPNELTGDHLNTTNGDVIIHPINHASFVMSWQGKMIYNDPVGGSARYANFPRADLILIGHAHTDHFDNTTLNGVTNLTTRIIAPSVVYNGMTTPLKAITTVLTNGGSTNLLGLHIDAIPAYNFTATYHPRGVGNGYVLTIADKHIYMAGDTEDIPEMRALRNIDVAFLPMNLPYTMNTTNAASAAREFRPLVVYPYHYGNVSPPGDPNDFKRRVGQDLGIEVRLRKWY